MRERRRKSHIVWIKTIWQVTGLYKYVLLDDRYHTLRESKEVIAKLKELKNLLS